MADKLPTPANDSGAENSRKRAFPGPPGDKAIPAAGVNLTLEDVRTLFADFTEAIKTDHKPLKAGLVGLAQDFDNFVKLTNKRITNSALAAMGAHLIPIGNLDEPIESWNHLITMQRPQLLLTLEALRVQLPEGRAAELRDATLRMVIWAHLGGSVGHLYGV